VGTEGRSVLLKRALKRIARKAIGDVLVRLDRYFEGGSLPQLGAGTPEES
jgi:hypothetical protein